MTAPTAAPHVGAPLEFCREILPHVSRTFALTIPVLREPLRDQVGIAYLLCRIADTVEDRPDLPPPVRRALFACLLHLAEDPLEPVARHDFQAMWPPHADEHHERLVRHAADVLDPYAALEPGTRSAIRDCLCEMIVGMASRPGPSPAGEPVSVCGDLEDLERYCHVVAGTVGILLTRLFAGALGDPGWGDPARMEEGRRFGLGLQLTNVVKDHAADCGRGVRYVPESFVEPATGLLTSPGLRALAERAVAHLEAGHRYILSLPRDRDDMRLFCLWAAHLALATLGQVARSRDGVTPPKVDRAEVPRILDRARLHVADDVALGALFADYRAAVLA